MTSAPAPAPGPEPVSAPAPGQADGSAQGDELRRFLARRNVHCDGCGYLLRACASDQCPECGVKITLESIYESIEARRSEHRGFGLLLIAASVPPLLLAAVVLIQMPWYTPAGQFAGLLVVGVLALLAAGPASFGWWLSRPRPTADVSARWSDRATSIAIFALVCLGVADIVILGVLALILLS